MSDQNALPQQNVSPAPAPADGTFAPVPPVIDAQEAWIDGYEPGNPWQSKLCLQTPYGTVSYPLTPHTMPELLEGLVMVAQAQQGTAGIPDPDEDDAADGPDGDRQDPAHGTTIHDGRAARMTGWTVVHELWEREDPKVRFIMGAVVVGLLILGIVLS
ncbi:hypothetical protein [Streptomyces sp. NBC_01244]|uniref:hypothetical protein n=1 Tax=Streptomyces sp. NBC_01244 TaxID=2903797 RepID=UPI002E0EE763|nr:hypothetical protein OG247_24290 [Streptomyces sp. NBC_01244]